MTPPFNWDLGATGKGPSVEWAFWTSYNTERATGKLETSSTQKDRDYLAVVHWKAAEQAASAGGAGWFDAGGVKVMDPAKVPGVMYLLPCGKSPHGVDVDPSGEYVICSGKLQPTSTVFSFSKIQDAIARKSFTGAEDGIPVIKYEDALVMEVPVGLGPLAHPVRRQGLRLHVAVRRERDRQVEAAALRDWGGSQGHGGG